MMVMLKLERFSWLKMVAVALSVCGSLLVVLAEAANDSPEEAPSRILGILCFVGNTVCFSVYVILQRPLFQRVTTRIITSGVFFSSGVVFLITGLFLAPSTAWAEITPLAWTGVLYVGLVATVISYTIYTHCTEQLGSVVASMGITVQPFGSILLGAIFLGERLLPLHFVGGILIVMALLLTVHARKREILEAQADAKSMPSLTGSLQPSLNEKYFLPAEPSDRTTSVDVDVTVVEGGPDRCSSDVGAVELVENFVPRDRERQHSSDASRDGIESLTAGAADLEIEDALSGTGAEARSQLSAHSRPLVPSLSKNVSRLYLS